MHHDVFEVAAADVMSNLKKYSVRCGFFSLEFLKKVLAKFNYADWDKTDKPQFVYKTGSRTDFKIKQDAIEMRNFIKLYPILVGNMNPEDDEVWDLLTSFSKIAEMISSPLYTIGETLVLR